MPEMEPMQIFAPDADGIQRAVALLGSGRFVAFPTETVCGLGGDLRKAKGTSGTW